MSIFEGGIIEGQNAGGGGQVSATGYLYYAAPALTLENVSTDQAISASGDGYLSELLDSWSAPAGIVSDTDFVTEWQGFVIVQVSDNSNLEIILRTYHTIGVDAKDLTHERKIYEDVAGRSPLTIPMSIFNSRARVVPGTYGSVTITEADISAASVIGYEMEVRAFNRRSTSNRRTTDLEVLTFSSNVKTVSYQLPQGVATALPGDEFTFMYGVWDPHTGGGSEIDSTVKTILFPRLPAQVTFDSPLITQIDDDQRWFFIVPPGGELHTLYIANRRDDTDWHIDEHYTGPGTRYFSAVVGNDAISRQSSIRVTMIAV